MNARLALALGLLCLASPAFASFKILNVVAVPMENGDEGSIELRYVTAWLDYTSAWPGVEVLLTCSAAPVQRFGSYEGTERETLQVDDENIAHEMGLTIAVENRYDSRTWNSASSTPPGARWGDRQGTPKSFYVDTLLVTLRTNKAYERAEQAYKQRASEFPNSASDSLSFKVLDAVVRTTIDCIRDNASRSAVPVRHVKLVVEGPARYRKLGGMMRITARPNRGPTHSY